MNQKRSQHVHRVSQSIEKNKASHQTKQQNTQQTTAHMNVYIYIHTHCWTLPAYGECGVASSVRVGLVHKHQLVAGVREPGTQEFLKETKHLHEHTERMKGRGGDGGREGGRKGRSE